ncbi:ring zinc finger transcription repressor [Encephalitozoon intestinalis ATCC 50506]|uniref:Ring zinc finger transcription repressor n=1 Tax=Encephalitozoon intestinalis (strain ATCC 50506) TaxID=876142 RepID=E0SA32_ENCIT|nr:ring zinc finger transcription repressor [Encephalitozoon intestinalis ATCC 50506]ADM12654.1 ring zinc finger transcription repressor [Encephalitozoon intestinalis ATCC 50506]UTX46514.1 RRM-CNOT4 domain-containing protein [Encephalitozoon intestinalis]
MPKEPMLIASGQPGGNFSNVRVVQKNLVYIICIPQKYADEGVLSRHEFFGQFGAIRKIVVNKRTSSLESTASAYITYSTDEEAKICIQEVDESLLDGKVLKCTYGTTKYCTFYLRNALCQNSDCMYLHEHRSQKDILTKDEMCNSKHKLHDFEVKNKNKKRIGKRYDFDVLNELFKHKTSRVFRAPDRILFEPLDFTN